MALSLLEFRDLTHDGIRVRQCKYAKDLIKSAWLDDARTFDTPLEFNVKISKDDARPLGNLTILHRLVGNLLYLTMTLPDKLKQNQLRFEEDRVH